MIKRLFFRMDPLLRLLVGTIVLAVVLPVTGHGRDIAQIVANCAIFCLFLLNGLRLPRADVLSGIRHWHFLLPVAIWSFGCMAVAGWGFAAVGQHVLPPEIALGFLFLGVLPSTVQSATAYSSLAGGDVANSVVAAAVLNLAGVLISAPLFAVLAGSKAPPFDLAALLRIVMLLLVPFVLGQILQGWAGAFAHRHKYAAGWADKLTIAIAVYVALSGAVEQGLWTRVNGFSWMILLALVLPYLAFAFGGAWAASGLLGLKRPYRISFLFAGGQKSIALGAPLAAVLFPPASAGMVLLPVLIFHMLQLVVSAFLAARLAAGSPVAEPA